ncbi:hypothetical protein WR25_24314 [Diploscapter pachys]|uniref:ZP domain-containing protein n=1 Tax=Diploscapter pachys TaxID=2018661 RepID=A0A2A2LZT7_9BILA|nr:hypothetical protein WR25_24314 [Diploscapter pachys]
MISKSEKQYLPRIQRAITVTEYSNATIRMKTEMILQTKNKIDCLAKCVDEVKVSYCRSVMFYPATNECLLNSADSSTSQLESEVDGSEVNYFEFHKLKSNDPCTSSFRHTSYEKLKLSGDVKIYNGTDGLRKCLDRCVDCDVVIYNEIYSECFVVQLDSTGQALDFVNEEYHIFTSLCRTPQPVCSPLNSIYIARHSLDLAQKKSCLEGCIAEPSCIYAYSNGTDDCIISSKPRQLTASITRKCSGIEKMPYGVLFEEQEVCRRVDSQMQVDDVDLTQCMQLCLTHPTQSCEAISYYSKKRACLLHDNLIAKGDRSLGCSYYTLNIIQLETETRKSERKSRKKALGTKSSKFENGLIPIISESFDDVKIETICMMNSIQVKISSSHSLHADVFVRNGHESCSVKIRDEKEGALLIPLKESGCPLKNEDHIYSAIIILKSNMRTNIPVITSEDRMFQIACNYSNQVQTIAKSHFIRMGDPYFTELPISGKVEAHKVLQMELREKREKLTKSINVGQEVDLVFKSNGLIKGGYLVRECIASNSDGKDNMTLIEMGCPSMSASNFIIRGGIKYGKDGFSIPFRAFRFQNGDDVNISCKVEMCDKECKKVGIF